MSIKVKAHSRGAPDPFAPVMEAKRREWCRKWNVELIGANDDRLAAPIPDPVPGPAPMPIEEHKSLLRTLAELVRGI
jgi:hypothetical protein